MRSRHRTVGCWDPNLGPPLSEINNVSVSPRSCHCVDPVASQDLVTFPKEGEGTESQWSSRPGDCFSTQGSQSGPEKLNGVVHRGVGVGVGGGVGGAGWGQGGKGVLAGSLPLLLQALLCGPVGVAHQEEGMGEWSTR